MTTTTAGDLPAQRTPGRRRRYFSVLACAGAALLAGAATWWSLRREPAAEPPAVAHEGLDPDVVRAIELARARVRADPRSGPEWGRLGTVLTAYNLHVEAGVCFARAEQLDPREPRWPYLHGLSLLADNPDALAMPRLRHAVELCAATPDAPRVRLAELLLKQGHLEEAEGHFRQLLEGDERHPRAHLGLGRIAVARGQLRQGLDEVRGCLHSPFTRKAAHLLLADLSQRSGDAAAAREALGQAEAWPEDAPWPDPFAQEVQEARVDEQALLRRAVGKQDRGEDEEARQLFEQLTRIHPALVQVLVARDLVDDKQYEAAERMLREVLREMPDSDLAHFLLGQALLGKGDPRGAAGCFRQALQLKPTHAWAWEHLGICLEQQGDRAGAVEALRTAARYMPQRGEIHRRLGTLLAQDGRQSEGLLHLERALWLNPGDVRARQAADRIRRRAAGEGR